MESSKESEGNEMIYTVTFNPSLDYIVSVEDFKLGLTNRTSSELMLPGGKGLNVSMVLGNLGIANTAFGFAAGFTGREIIRRIEEMGVKSEFIPIENGISRINLKLKSIDGTEINGSGPEISEDAIGKLMEKLNVLKEGDVFTVTVLDETFTYMIDQIRIVLPEETDELAIVDDKEYATLVTCTPYGVNSHRMLMRGHRIANIDGKATPADAVKIPTYIVIPAVGIPLLFVVLLGMLIYYRKKKPGKTAQETLNDIRKQ